jgi:hypothetical protein
LKTLFLFPPLSFSFPAHLRRQPACAPRPSAPLSLPFSLLERRGPASVSGPVNRARRRSLSLTRGTRMSVSSSRCRSSSRPSRNRARGNLGLGVRAPPPFPRRPARQGASPGYLLRQRSRAALAQNPSCTSAAASARTLAGRHARAPPSPPVHRPSAVGDPAN